MKTDFQILAELMDIQIDKLQTNRDKIIVRQTWITAMQKFNELKIDKINANIASLFINHN